MLNFLIFNLETNVKCKRYFFLHSIIFYSRKKKKQPDNMKLINLSLHNICSISDHFKILTQWPTPHSSKILKKINKSDWHQKQAFWCGSETLINSLTSTHCSPLWWRQKFSDSGMRMKAFSFAMSLIWLLGSWYLPVDFWPLGKQSRAVYW